ncbi:class I SAM-dependent methyltransferase [Actinokineospora sp. 24-640]
MSVFDPRATYGYAAANYLAVREGIAPFCLDDVVGLMGLHPGDRVLDMACGPGGVALRAARMAGAVVGADTAEPMLALARAGAVEAGLGNTVFEVADLDDPPYAPETFDAVACSLGVFFAADVTAAVARLWGLVRPGGRLVLAVMGQSVFAPAAGVFVDAVQTRVPGLVVETPWTRTADMTTLRETVAAAGVPGACFTHRDYVTRLTSPDDWWSLMVGSGFGNVVMRMDEADADAVRLGVGTWMADHGVDRLTTGVHFATAAKEA